MTQVDTGKGVSTGSLGNEMMAASMEEGHLKELAPLDLFALQS